MSKRSYTIADKIHALKVYELCDGNLSAAARETEIPRKTLARWVAEHARSGESQMADNAPDGQPLNPKLERFISEHLRGKSATDSAAAAGYQGDRDTLATTGWRLLRNAEIQRRIQERLASAARLTDDQIIGTLVDQMSADQTDFLNESGHFSLDVAKQNGVTHLLKKLEYDEWGGIKKFEIYSAQTAAVQLSKIRGIEQEPAKNKGQLVRRMLEKLIKHGASREQAARDLVSMAVNEDDVKSALAEIAAHEPQPA